MEDREQTMEDREQTAPLPEESRTIAPRRTKSWRRRVAIGFVVLAGVVFLFRGLLVRTIQFRRTGSVSALGNTYYIQPKDQVITQRLLTFGIWEAYETEEVREILRPGDTFIDVGADFGWYSVIGSKAVGPTGRVIAFEPVPSNLEFLRRNVAANGCANVQIEPMALSNKSEQLTFHLSSDNLGDHSRLEAKSRPTAIDVRAIALDEYLKDDPGRIALIKIDTQGSEGYILEGMRETLRKHPEMVIIMEFTPSWLRETGYDPEAMLHKLHEQGYEIRYLKGGKLRKGVASTLGVWESQRTVPLPESQFAAFVKDNTSSAQDLLIRKSAQR
jgi:FkbM family methyltransferase